MSVETEVEARLGQALVAFGQGAGSLRVSREVVEALRGRYETPLRKEIQADPEKVKNDIGGLLDIVRAMGRLSSDLATAAGELTIEKPVFEKAVQTVEGNVQRRQGRERPTPYCGAASGREGGGPVTPR